MSHCCQCALSSTPALLWLLTPHVQLSNLYPVKLCSWLDNSKSSQVMACGTLLQKGRLKLKAIQKSKQRMPESGLSGAVVSDERESGTWRLVKVPTSLEKDAHSKTGLLPRLDPPILPCQYSPPFLSLFLSLMKGSCLLLAPVGLPSSFLVTVHGHLASFSVTEFLVT